MADSANEAVMIDLNHGGGRVACSLLDDVGGTLQCCVMYEVGE